MFTTKHPNIEMLPGVSLKMSGPVLHGHIGNRLFVFRGKVKNARQYTGDDRKKQTGSDQKLHPLV